MSNLALAALFAAGDGVSARAEAPPATMQTGKPAAPPAAAAYAAPGACGECHEEEAAALAKTKHGQTKAANWDAATSCETCHGPGGAHVDAGGTKETIRNPDHMTAAEINATCLSCHERGDRSHWMGSQHEGRGL
ncbi:MAG TPA: hypothetical protein VMQ62_15320, partial [Dongiaceae bacterium]|nr:hypothetical protein [Dongiaceae bacterium]